MKKRAALLCLLACLLLVLSGCMRGGVSVVNQQYAAPGKTSGELLIPMKQGGMSQDYFPAKDLTIDEVKLEDDAYFVIVNEDTQEQFELKELSIERDPSVSYLNYISEDDFEFQLGILASYNLAPGRYMLTDVEGHVSYRTQQGTRTSFAMGMNAREDDRRFVIAAQTAPTTAAPTATPTPSPTATPTAAPTAAPTATPTVTPVPALPKTGDNASVGTWMLLLLLCGAGFLLVRRRAHN